MDSIISSQSDLNLPTSSAQNHETTNPKERRSLKTKFFACIGAHEFSSPEIWKAALTELVATACLLFTLTASIFACLDSHDANPKLLVPVAVDTSPVFTFIAALKGFISPARAFTYISAQCVGSITGFLLLSSVINHEAAKKYFFGGCTIDGVSPGTALILEFFCTFVVLFVGVSIAFDKRRSKELGLSMVCAVVAGAMALEVFVSITVTGKVGCAGVGLNPAMCLGPSLLLGGSLWDGHWIFWIGPCFACVIYYGFTKGLPKEGLVWEDEERDFISLVAPSLCCSGPRSRTQPHGKINGNCESMNN
ncbi:Calcium-binding EF-hand family protein [Hibiscus syriacus]|uniref:Calcium-binding EF-hand family protein n=1 Tax=Hibiscus syriacus TaxID=106335 RepID=A0A6A2X7C5_HIBSY|nr:Calcium-binding EF-hand family protein [Hibiscus syriacus]